MMGRKPLIETGELDLEVLKKCWEKYHRITKVAETLGLAYKTTRKYLLSLGLTRGKRGRPPTFNHKHYSQMATWVKAHPTTKLPRSAAKISKLTGLSIDVVKCYLYRRRKEIKDMLMQLPSLSSTDEVFLDHKGQKIPLRYLKTYNLKFDPWSFQIYLEGILKPNNRRIKWKLKRQHLRRFFK